MLTTARQLKGTPGLVALRAGVWKPRTRPGTFEGIGEQALEWLVEAGRELDLPVATEVAKSEHVEACLKAGVEIMWVGARSTVNPLYVQEIAEALRGTDAHVLVKNPIHPDVKLWSGAIERFQKVGIQHLAAVHRGYFSLGAHPYRNEAGWELAVTLREMQPDVPILCDPSHIAGRRELIAEICQIALDLDLEGLMIETHHDPINALSDAEQQVTPSQLNKIISQLQVRAQRFQDLDGLNALGHLREQIDQLDQELVVLLFKRFGLVDSIAEVKGEQNLAVFQRERWMEILSSRAEQGGSLGLEEEFVKELFRVIHKQALQNQVRQLHKEDVSDSTL
jgi:chorismate mutase